MRLDDITICSRRDGVVRLEVKCLSLGRRLWAIRCSPDRQDVHWIWRTRRGGTGYEAISALFRLGRVLALHLNARGFFDSLSLHFLIYT